MRLDRFLKVSRVIKRRVISKDLAVHQKVQVNGKIVKPSYQLQIGDIVEVTFLRHSYRLQVLKLSGMGESMYQVLS